MAISYQRKRRFKYGSNAIILSLSVLGLLAVAYFAVTRLNWRVDLTANRSLTLAPQTQEVLAGLTQAVTIRAFFRQAGDLDQVFIRRKVDDVLSQYAGRSHQIDYRMLDPDVAIEEALQFGIQQDGTIVFQSGSRRKDIYQSVLFHYPSMAEASPPLFVGESLFTNALLSLLQEQVQTICLLSGHGERSTEVTDADGLSDLQRLVMSENFSLETISLQETAAWQERCALLLVPGPKLGLHPAEDMALRAYLESGKKLVLMVDPQSRPGLSKTLDYLGIRFENAVVFDPARHFVLGPHYPTPVLSDHEVAASLREQGVAPVFYLARPIVIAKEPSLEVIDLLQSSPAAWGEKQLKAGEEPKATPGVDLEGALSLGVAVAKKASDRAQEIKEKKQEADTEGEENDEAAGSAAKPTIPVALVFGDSNFVTNGLIQVPGNRALILNGLAWLLGQAEQLAIRPQQADFRPLVVSAATARWLGWGTQLFYPAIILLLGLSYWWRRRRRS